ncbi:DUF2789 domain-containing protein [Arsukibacterium sp.]|uniref:DUF2789 domain-containing protein n=1 Tax=Arsukibacterium sp. TaxID=1977258 RepID=UPI002FDA6DEF
MDTSSHNLSTLFAQFGLDSEPEAIDKFVQQHRLHAQTSLSDAPFWNQAQASFIREAWRADSDWAEVIDELNSLLH